MKQLSPRFAAPPTPATRAIIRTEDTPGQRLVILLGILGSVRAASWLRDLHVAREEIEWE
jgi:hypothetical protein